MNITTPNAQLALKANLHATIKNITALDSGYKMPILESSQLTLIPTADPTVMILRDGGTDITLHKNPYSSEFSGGTATKAYIIRQLPGGIATDKQMALAHFEVIDSASVGGDLYNINKLGFSVYGLETNPADMPTSGSATYSGIGKVTIVHGLGNSGSGITDANATTSLTADFGAGTISGSMLLTEGHSNGGMSIPAGGTTLTMNPAAISGNGFSGTWSASNLADLHLGSLDTANYQGNFYGNGASDVGGILTGSGYSALPGIHGALIYGGFMGQ